MCAIIFIVVAAVIIPQWRIPGSELVPLAISLAVPLTLNLAFVVVFLLDLTCTLLCAHWKRFTRVIFCYTLCKRWFLALAEVVWKTRASRFECWFKEVCDCVTTGHVVWDEFLRVENCLLCAATSICEQVCAKLRSSVVFMSRVSTE